MKNILLGIIAAQPTIIVQNGLIGYWKANEGSGTTVGATIGNNGTITGSPAWEAGVKGVAGTALRAQFNGDIVTISRTGLEPTTAISLVAWVYLTTTNSAQTKPMIQKLITDHINPPYLSFQISFQGGLDRPAFSINVNGTYELLNSTTAVSLNTWYMITGAWSSGSPMRLYINNTLNISSANKTGSITHEDMPVTLLTHGQLTTRYLLGRATQFRIYNRELSLAEVETIYNAEKP